MIDPGQMRTKLVLQTSSTTKNIVSQDVVTWIDGPTVWARLSPLSGKEQYWASQINATTTHVATCRFRPDITSENRFKVAGTNRILNIDGVLDFESRRIELTINVTEGVE